MLAFIGRILIGIPLLLFGFFHFMGADKMAAMVPIPGGVFWIYLTGLALILAGLALIINKRTRIAMLLLALMLLIFAFTVHLPAMIGAEEEAKATRELVQILKNLGLAGGALLAGAFYSQEVDAPSS